MSEGPIPENDARRGPFARVVEWLDRQAFERAYETLRKTAQRHMAKGHDVEFKAVGEGLISLHCHTCCPGARARATGSRTGVTSPAVDAL